MAMKYLNQHIVQQGVYIYSFSLSIYQPGWKRDFYGV